MSEELQMKKSSEKIRLAVIGIGKMGLLHTCILNVLPNANVIAVCDKSPIIRKMSSKIFRNMKFVDDVRNLEGLGLDAIYLTTPIPSHYPLAKTLYSNKIAANLFVEKTLASDYAKAKELCDLAAAANGISMVGYMKRFSVTFRKAKNLLDQGMLGDLTSFEAHAYSSDFAASNRGSGISAARGGVLSDLGSHVIDIALWFFGDLAVKSAKLRSTNKTGSEDSVMMKTEGTDGLIGNFDISWSKKEYRMPEFGLAIMGNKGNLAVNDDEVIFSSVEKSQKWYRHDLGDSVSFLLGDSEYCRENEEFISSVLVHRKCESDFNTASKVDLVIEQARDKGEFT
jgi:predicted dehydrogenase